MKDSHALNEQESNLSQQSGQTQTEKNTRGRPKRLLFGTLDRSTQLELFLAWVTTRVASRASD